MDSELEMKGKYTRGKVLKRAGIGAAALYTAPFLVSSAAAAVPGRRCIDTAFAQGLDCACDTCINGNIVNQCTASCFCFIDVKGCCQCRGLGGGCGNPRCNTSADCPRGFKCVLTCCDGGGQNRGLICLPPCSGSEGAATAAERAVVHA